VVSVKTRPVDSEIDVVNVVSTHTPLVSSATDEPSPSLDKNLDPPKESSKRSVASIPEELSAEQLAEARRIAKELVKLHRDGAIKTAGDASFYANLIRDFGTTYAGPPGSAAGEHSPGLVPQPPHGISPQERIKFYQEDLGHAFGDQFIDHAEEGYPPPGASRSSAGASSTRK
jgi:hypothetical protein